MAAPASTNISIRDAGIEDVPILHALIGELAKYERLEAQFVAEPEQLRRFLFGDRPVANAIVAELGGEPAGFALYFHTFSTFLGLPGLYLEDLYVRESLRGRGVGRALLRHVAHTAIERGCGRLEWSVLDWNEPAIGFYRELGARPMGEWTVYRVAGAALSELAGS
ncbi:MAG TPA: GNAT family N-acetyltransferase [Gammaproteobacteria bacterium]|nr:GNAT family N-acetyltransferase [Gammaproteobacteria bacterium]